MRYKKVQYDTNKMTKKITYTISEFCARYDISRTTFYRLKKENKLPPIQKLKKKCFLKKTDSEKWFNNLKNNK